MSFPSCVQRELFTDVMLSSSPPFSSHTHTVPSLFDYCLYSKHQGGSVTSYSTAPVKWTGSERENVSKIFGPELYQRLGRKQGVEHDCEG